MPRCQSRGVQPGSPDAQAWHARQHVGRMLASMRPTMANRTITHRNVTMPMVAHPMLTSMQPTTANRCNMHCDSATMPITAHAQCQSQRMHLMLSMPMMLSPSMTGRWRTFLSTMICGAQLKGVYGKPGSTQVKYDASTGVGRSCDSSLMYSHAIRT